MVLQKMKGQVLGVPSSLTDFRFFNENAHLLGAGARIVGNDGFRLNWSKTKTGSFCL